MNLVLAIAAGCLLLLVLVLAYRIGKIILRVCVGLAALGLLSWWLWTLFHA